jgi:phosphosulfolactate synthase
MRDRSNEASTARKLPTGVAAKALAEILDRGERTAKPREFGITMLLDRGEVGPNAILDLGAVGGAYADYAKIAWASALITGALEEKIDAYRRIGVTPTIGGTLFEYAYLRKKVPALLEAVKALKVHVEISDGVVELPRAEKLHWIEQFSKHVDVFSEVGGKLARQDHDWKAIIGEELSAGSHKIVIEGREIGPVGGDLRTDFVQMICDCADPKDLVFEALERKQQWSLIKLLGPNVNLGNIPVAEVMTVESYRLGLKDRTILQTWERVKESQK